MNRIVCAFAFILLAKLSYAQTTSYPSGGYKTLEELRNGQPTVHANFQLVYRANQEILFYGGNDYFMTTTDKTVGQKIVVKELTAVCIHDSLYINTVPFKLATGYSDALTRGRYIAFRSGFRDKKKSRVMSAAMMLNPASSLLALPVLITAATAKAKSAERHLLIIDTQTGILCLCDSKFLVSILKSFPDIEYQYSIELEQNDEEVLLKYVKLINTQSGNH